MFQLRQGAAICRVAADELLILGEIHCGGDYLIDIPHGLGAQSFGLAFRLDSLYPAASQQLFVELL